MLGRLKMILKADPKSCPSFTTQFTGGKVVGKIENGAKDQSDLKLVFVHLVLQNFWQV